MTPLHNDPAFRSAMPATAGAMREAAAAIPMLGLLTVVFAVIWATSLATNAVFATGVLPFAGWAAAFTASVAVLALTGRSLIAYAVLTFNTVVMETVRIAPIPVLSIQPTADHAAFYSRLVVADKSES